jgi:hypothetical protein
LVRAHSESFPRVGNEIFFPRVPRAPVSPPPHPPKPDTAIRRLAARPDVVVLDEHLFDSLERPELFVDGFHLNRTGMERFSRILATAVSQHLGPPKAQRNAL